MPPSNRELEPDTVIDISHESLMRVWQRLRNLVEEEAQSARIYRRLVDTSSLWKKEEAGLYHDPDLQIAQSWRDKYQPNKAWADLYGGGFKIATKFLEASEEEGRKAEREKEAARQRELQQAQELAEARERSARNMKRFAAVVGVVAIIALGAMLFAVKQQKIAVEAQGEAVIARSIAESAQETLRLEFIRSDVNLGLSFSEQGEPGRGIAHFARALEREPNSPAIIDRSFNILAYAHPPGYRSPQLNFESNYIETSTASANGSIVLTGIYRNNEEQNQTPNLMVWKPHSKKPLYSIHVNPGRFRWGNDIALSPDGKTAAMAVDGIVTLNLEDGSTKKIADAIRLRGIKYSTDGKRLLTGTGQQRGNVAQIWDATTGELIKTYETKAFFPRWSPDETKILYPRHRHGQSAVLDIATESLTLFNHEGTPQLTEYGSFDKTGDRFISISRDDKFNVWNIDSGELEYTLQHGQGKQGNINGSVGVFTPDNQRILTVAHDLAIKLWNAADGTLIDTVNIALPHAFMHDPLFSDDGKRVIIPLQNGQAYSGIFDETYSALPEFGDPVPITEAHAFLVNNGKLRPLLLPLDDVISGTPLGTNNLLLGTTNGTAIIYDLNTGEKTDEEIKHTGEIRAVATSLDGTKIATASNWGSVKVWNRSNLTSPMTVINQDEPTKPTNFPKLQFTPDGKALWVNSGSDNAKKWDVEKGQIITDTKIRPTMSISASSKDGALTAITRWQFIKVFNNNLKAEHEPFTVHGGGRIDAATFTPDNKLLVTGTVNGKIRLWSTSDGTKQKTRFDLELAGSPENIKTIDVSPDSKLLAAGCASGNIYVFELSEGSKEKQRTKPQGEVFRSEIITKESPGRSVDIDVAINGAKKLYLVVEEGDDGWQHDVANWAEPRLVIEGTEKKLTELEWVSATADWGAARINKDAAGNAMTINYKPVSYGIGTHATSVIEFDLPSGVERFKARGGIDDNVMGDNNKSSLRFSVYTAVPPEKGTAAIATITGDSACSSVVFSESGQMIAAVFTDNESSYAEVWEAETAFSLTGKLQNKTGISKVAFHHNDTQIIAWPEQFTGGSQGLASVWDVSVGESAETNTDLPNILKAFGKLELNKDSQAVLTGTIENKLSLTEHLNPETNLAKFFNWLKEFPSLRGDSPFRPNPSEDYVNLLMSQGSGILLEEAVRLDPNNAMILAKRGAYRLSISDYSTDSVKALAESEITRALLLEPTNAEVNWYAAITHESLENQEKSTVLYKKAKELKGLTQSGRLGLIALQEKLKTQEPNRRELLNQEVIEAEKKDAELTKELIIKRFIVAGEGNNYEGAIADWGIIKEWETLPTGINSISLAQVLLSATEKEADRLVANDNYEAAVELLKPVSIASLSTPNNNLSPVVSKLIEWDNRETPPKTIIPAKSSWDYFDKGTDPGKEWFQPWFPSEGWSNGLAKLGYGDDGEVTSLGFGGDLTNKFPAYYFRHKFNVTEETKKPFLFANVIRDDGIIVYLNGKEVIRNNMPLGEVNYLTFSSDGANPENRELEPIRFPIDGDALEIGENVIAAEIHQTNGASSDIALQLELLGSNQDATSYIQKLLSGETGAKLLGSTMELFPKTQREDMKTATLLALGKLSKEELDKTTIDQASAAISFAQKLKKNDTLITIVDHKVKLLENSPTAENLTERVRTLNYKRNTLRQSGVTRELVDQIDKTISTPPRSPNLSPKLIDLSAHYTASMFHYTGWHGGHENFDLRFLPEKYDQTIGVPFDLRGLIQLQSGQFDDGNTANDFWNIRRHNKVYPNEVTGIEVNDKAQKIHFLIGALFAHNTKSGSIAAKLVIHYEDETSEIIPLISKKDIFDWWAVGWAEGLDSEKMGWLGENNLGNSRFLTKPVWENPYPDKVISHIDFVSGLVKIAPFLVAITME